MFFRFVLIFLWELLLANIEVARLVLSPVVKIRPGFLAVPMMAETDLEITSLANTITLTPGTISVHVARDNRTLVIHALNIKDDADDVRRTIQDRLEANILKWSRSEPKQLGEK